MQEICRVKTSPVALSDNMIIGEKYRITVLTEALVRLEYSEDGVFEDRATQTVLFRDFPKTGYHVVRNADGIEVHTSMLHLIYNEKEFSSHGLSIQIKGNLSAYHSIWHYGEKVHDLQGTARTLDDVNGEVELGHGVVSRFGYSILDDSKSQILLDDGWIEPRKKGVSDLYFFGYGHDYKQALNDFYRLWLDETMNYSCGYFKTENDTLYEAQVNKTDYILKKLALEEGMSLLDVGCGWGFLLIRAAKEYGVRGTGITLSTEQYEGFKKRIEEEGLEHLLNVQLMDYRDLPKSGMKFDRVVSVGMVEHVGRENYGRFMDCVDKVLNPGGVFLLHFISSQKEHAGDPWIKKYIFPGGVIPSLREIISLMAEHDFHILDVENLRNHYNKTLLCWEKNFKEHESEIKDMFDEEFVRMWDLYLCSCAATFHNGVIDLHQILVSKGANNELPMVRWY